MGKCVHSNIWVGIEDINLYGRHVNDTKKLNGNESKYCKWGWQGSKTYLVKIDFQITIHQVKILIFATSPSVWRTRVCSLSAGTCELFVTLPTILQPLYCRASGDKPAFITIGAEGVAWSGNRCNIKIWSYEHRNSHCSDTTIVTSSNLNNRISCTGNISHIYWKDSVAWFAKEVHEGTSSVVAPNGTLNVAANTILMK